MWTHDIRHVRVPLLTTETDPEAGDVTETVTGWRDGYAMNGPRALFDAIEALEPYRVDPDQPFSLFAGDEQDGEGRWTLTGFLRFADEATARAVLSDYWIEETQADE